MKRTMTAVLAAAALLSAAMVASAAGTANAGGPPPTFNEAYRSIPITVNGDYTPIVGFGCNPEEAPFILWYAPGPSPDFKWEITGIEPLTYTSEAVTVNGDYVPRVGDFDDNGCDDILWYGPGAAPDHIWWGELDGAFSSSPIKVNGTYEPVTGLFGEGGEHDILWYSPGAGAEYFWAGKDDRTFASRTAPSVSGTYRVESLGTGILFHKPGPGSDYVWGEIDAATGDHTSRPLQINGSYLPQASFYGVLLYGPGSAQDHLVYGSDEQGKPSTIPGMINGTYVDDVRSPSILPVHVWHAPGSTPDFLWVPASVSEASADAMASTHTSNEFGR